MSISMIIFHTPIWVWVLFVFLVNRGIKALQPREMSWQRMLVLPIIFFVWAVYSITTELLYLFIAFGFFAGALVTGVVIGWFLGMRLPRARLNVGNGLIYRPGTSVTLILISIGFLIKYALSVALIHHPVLANDPSYCALYGAVSGMVDGIFWGLTFLQLLQARDYNGYQVT